MSKPVKVQGIECPIIREGDDIVDIVVNAIDKDLIEDKAVIGITESIVARAAGQYITVDDIAKDIVKKFGENATIYLFNPIYSRNRFAIILKGIARGAKKLIINMPEYDEVGNPSGINPFTGVDIKAYYKELCESENCECEIINENRSLPYNTIYCGLHDYDKHSGWSLKDICSDVSPDWGVLGTNKSTEEKLKLFPSKAEAQRVCDAIKMKIYHQYGKNAIVCVYGDGCFKDPVGRIWEFADPITMPAYTDKELLESTPFELKLKNMIDENPSNEDIEHKIAEKYADTTITPMNRMGTTPRIYRDLLASLMDLTSGSGDRATPVVLINNYF